MAGKDAVQGGVLGNALEGVVRDGLVDKPL
jgi:hypothetical protein